MSALQLRRPNSATTVAEVLRSSTADRRCGARRLRSAGAARSAPATVTPAPPPPLMTPPTPPSPHLTAGGRRRGRGHHPASSARTRRPVDEALFCAHRMESEDDVLRQLRACGPVELMESFQVLCSSLSLHNVRLAEFTFLCAAVVQCPVQPRDCEVVFAFLRAERTSGGGISVAQLLPRLRTLFEPMEVLCALQLKCLLETHRLDQCHVSLVELESAVAGLRSLLRGSPLDGAVATQWSQLLEELQRLQVLYAVPVPTVRLLVRRSARALRSAVRALGWDGKVRKRLMREGDDDSTDPTARGPVRAFDASRLAAYTQDDETSHHAGAPDHSSALLSAVTAAYRHRLDARVKPPVAADAVGAALWATVRTASRVSAWRSPKSAADPTHPRFTADLYAVVPASPSRAAARLAA
ncbi:hypothetical protein NESM_000814000 [Novymonas esmeraldas]|uniref:Uncharacterized protein n=1 Tax=Novymonas esmeraldas TaxID=1808958 RepID=A0AAW0EX01_9TRYP